MWKAQLNDRRPVASCLVLALTAVGCGGGMAEGGGRGSIATVSAPVPSFPFPPPTPSNYATLSSQFVAPPEAGRTVWDVARNFESALNEAGYYELSWSPAPHGFAVTTKIEQIGEDRLPTADRWLQGYPSLRMFSREWWHAVFLGHEGRYRMFAFVVTDQNFQFAPPAAEDTARTWAAGEVAPPDETRAEIYTSQHACYALVYEFVRHEPEPQGTLDPNVPGVLTQLETAGIAQHLRQTAHLVD